MFFWDSIFCIWPISFLTPEFRGFLYLKGLAGESKGDGEPRPFEVSCDLLKGGESRGSLELDPPISSSTRCCNVVGPKVSRSGAGSVWYWMSADGFVAFGVSMCFGTSLTFTFTPSDDRVGILFVVTRFACFLSFDILRF